MYNPIIKDVRFFIMLRQKGRTRMDEVITGTLFGRIAIRTVGTIQQYHVSRLQIPQYLHQQSHNAIIA